MKDQKDLDVLLDALNREDVQEREIESHEKSFFATAPDDATIVARAREFDDVHKHWVRRDLWLKTVRKIHKAKGSGVRLLTLPGQHSFEIKLYAKENLLELHAEDDKTACLAVVGFETDPTVFGLLKTTAPILMELLCGDVLSALIEPQSDNGQTIRKHAPYDIINLDLTTNIATENDGPYSPFLRGVRECFQLQGAQSGRWALMVTFRAGMAETEASVINVLETFFEENLKTHLKVKEACHDRYGVDSAKKVLENTPEEGLGQITAKWIIEQGHQFEWECNFFRHATYERTYVKQNSPGRYSLRKLVFEFSRRPTGSREIVCNAIPAQSWHAEDLARLFESAALLDVDKAVTNISPEYRRMLENEIEELR